MQPTSSEITRHQTRRSSQCFVEQTASWHALVQNYTSWRSQVDERLSQHAHDLQHMDQHLRFLGQFMDGLASGPGSLCERLFAAESAVDTMWDDMDMLFNWWEDKRTQEAQEGDRRSPLRKAKEAILAEIKSKMEAVKEDAVEEAGKAAAEGYHETEKILRKYVDQKSQFALDDIQRKHAGLKGLMEAFTDESKKRIAEMESQCEEKRLSGDRLSEFFDKEAKNRFAIDKMDARLVEAEVVSQSARARSERVENCVESLKTDMLTKVDENQVVGCVADAVRKEMEKGREGLLTTMRAMVAEEVGKRAMMAPPTAPPPPVTKGLFPTEIVDEIPAPPLSHPPPVVFAEETRPARVENVRWTKTLSKLTFQNVRQWIYLFRSFIAASGLSEAAIKLTLLQHLEGDAATFVTPLIESNTSQQIMEALLSRVRPAESVLIKKLLETKMKAEESMQTYVTRFLSLANEIAGYTEERKREVFVDNLRSSWRKTARGYIRHMGNVSLQRLAEELIELEGPDANHADDLMDIDHVGMKYGRQFDCGHTEDVRAVETGRSMRDLCDAMRAELARNPRFRGIMESMLREWRQPNNMRRPDLRPAPRTPLARPPQGRQFQGNCYQCGKFGHSAKFCRQRAPQVRETRPVHTENSFDALAAIEEEEFADEEVSVHTVEVREQDPFPDRSEKRTKKPAKPQPVLTNTMRKRSPDPQIQYIDYPRRDQATNSNSAVARTSLKVATYLANRPEKEQALVDTGAEVSLLPLRYCQKWGIKVKKLSSVRLRGFNNADSQVQGEVALPTRIGGWNQVVKFYVTNATEKVILGYPALRAFGVSVDCATDQLVGQDGSVVFCRNVSSN